MTPDDIIEQEVLNSVVISPDHTMLAYVRWHPTSVLSLFGRYRGDVWTRAIESTDKAINITESQSKRGNSSYSSPSWSPDGSQLAMLSFNETTGFHVAVWNRATKRLTEFENVRPLHLQIPLWLDNERLILTIPASDSPATKPVTSLTSYATFAYEGALTAKNGTQPTGRTFDSGTPLSLDDYPQERVVLMKMDGHIQTLASGVQLGDVSVSPDRHYVAFLKQTGKRPLNGATTFNYDYQDLGRYGDSFGLAIVDLAGTDAAIQMGAAQFVKPKSFQWAPDSKSFALVATVKGDPLAPHVFRGTIGETLAEVQLGGGVTPHTYNFAQTVLWTTGGHLLLAGEHADESRAAATKRLDWWEVPATGAPRLITRDMNSVPVELSAIPGGRVLGVADGHVWSLKIGEPRWTNLTASFTPRVSRLRLTDRDSPFAERVSVARALVSTRNREKTEYYRLDITSGALTPMTLPSPLAEPVAYDGYVDVALMQASEAAGTYLTLDRRGQTEQIVALNEKLRQISPAQIRAFNYTGADGEQLKAWLLLPPAYQEGKRYPLVTWVYAGNTYDVPPSETKINANEIFAGEFSLQLFASRGYAVLLPSMPLSSRGQASDVYLDLTKGVLPAIDKAIELGIADPTRLAVAGLSFGGFSVYGLITQTNRFQAAVAMSGISDFVGSWGTFGYRYFAEEKRQRPPMAGVEVMEAGAGRMANPPWRDAARYTRNSPIFYADRVRTPLLIIHGDLDVAVPIQQAEEFFMAMFRLGKRARYVQYTGEGHVLQSAANIRNMWMYLYAWLDEFCDISRDERGNLIFAGDHVASRNAAPALKPEDFARFNEIELRSRPWISRATEAAPSVSK